jgi:hypothetical protein
MHTPLDTSCQCIRLSRITNNVDDVVPSSTLALALLLNIDCAVLLVIVSYKLQVNSQDEITVSSWSKPMYLTMWCYRRYNACSS